jgi:hypothetical protein
MGVNNIFLKSDFNLIRFLKKKKVSCFRRLAKREFFAGLNVLLSVYVPSITATTLASREPER